MPPRSALDAPDAELLKPQGDGIDAVAQIGGSAIALSFKDVAQVTATGGTSNFGSLATQTQVLDVQHAVFCQGCIEAWPATVRVELRGAAKELSVAGLAGIDALCLGIGVLTKEGRFSTCLPQDVVLRARQLLSPLFIGFRHGEWLAVGTGGLGMTWLNSHSRNVPTMTGFVIYSGMIGVGEEHRERHARYAVCLA